MVTEDNKGVHWRVVPEDEAASHWDGWLKLFQDNHIRQCHRWGRHKKGAWQTVYTGLFNGPTPLALGLCLVRRAPLGAATVVWINGGPVFQKAAPATQDLPALKRYLEGLKSHFSKIPRAVVRLSPQLPMNLEAQLIIRQAGFERPVFSLGTALTYIVDLKKDLTELRENLEKNWRHQLRSAEKMEPEISIGRDRALLARYLPIHNDMCRRKGLAHQQLTLERLEAMVSDLGEQIIFLIVSAKGQDGCGGALWTFADKGTFALSSANEWGRKNYLPNAMFWRAIGYLKETGHRSFDVAGIDPGKVWSVYNFKRGLNAEPVEYLGEWEWSNSPWTQRAFNLALWAKQDSLA